MKDAKLLAAQLVTQYEAGYSNDTLAATITEAMAEETTLLKACSFFLNMLPNESHPNNEFGVRTSYDMAAKLDRYFRDRT